MLARNGAGPGHRSNDGEARKSNATGERQRTFTTEAQSTQGGRGLKSAVAAVSVAAGGEESDTYGRVITRLNDRWRIIACRDDIQWILQVRHGQRWRSRYFYRSREGLVRGCREYAGEIGGDALVILLRLPRFFGGNA